MDSFFEGEDNPQACIFQLEDFGHIFGVAGLDQRMDQQNDGTGHEVVRIHAV